MPDDGSRREGPDPLATVARRCVQLLVAAFTVGVAFWALGHVLVVVVPVILAVCLVTVLEPPRAALRRRGWRPLLATLAVVVGALLVLGGLVAALAPAVVTGIDDLGDSVSDAVDDAEEFLQRLGIEQAQLERGVESAREGLTDGPAGQEAVTGLVVAVEVVAGIALTLVLAVYLLHSGDRLGRGALELTPARYRDPVRTAARTTWSVLGSYVRGTAVVGLVDAVSLGLGLLLLGVPLVIPLAVLTFFGAFLPFVGAFVTGLLAALVALVSQGPLIALAVVGLAVLVQQLEGDIVQPRVFARGLDLHPVVTICAIATGAAAGGILGAFLAVPITAIVGTLLRERHLFTASG